MRRDKGSKKSRGVLDENTNKKLVDSLVKGNLWEVVRAYEKYPETQKLIKIPRTGDTALHVAVSYGAEELVKIMVSKAKSGVLEIGNNQGDTALHQAAKFGNAYLCKLIAEKDDRLLGKCNAYGETPLFLAVTHGKNEAFLYLHNFCKDKKCLEYGTITRNDGDTILHSAIAEVNFYLAYIIIHEYSELVNKKNNDGLLPLHLLATKPSVFPSGLHLYGIQKLVSYCVRVEKLEAIPDLFKAPDAKLNWSEAHLWMKHFEYKFKPESIELVEAINPQVDQSKNQQDEEPPFQQVDHGEIYQQDEEAANMQVRHGEIDQKYEKPANEEVDKEYLRQDNYETSNEEDFYWVGWILVLLLPVLLVILAVCYAFILPFKFVKYIFEYARVKRIKERSIWSVEVMNKLIDYQYAPFVHPSSQEYNAINKEGGICASNQQPPKQEVEPPIFIAAKHGISEIVLHILEMHPEAIYDVNAEKNIVMLAVEHRHPRLYRDLNKNWSYKKNIFGQLDKSGNSLLHLAANLGAGKQFWRIRGAALHMQMEIKWYKFIKKSMPARFFTRYNTESERKTAKEIFQKSHENLIKEGRQWLTSTSQPCSVVAALIATVAFATSTTVPGGLKQDNGTPILAHKPVFIISASASLIALSSSIISVVMFLGILTSNFKQKDFRKDLPNKLLLGLISLLISIASMFISFFAGHYFVLKQEFNNYATLVYMLLGFPLVVFIITKFPLDFEVLWTTLHKTPHK